MNVCILARQGNRVGRFSYLKGDLLIMDEIGKMANLTARLHCRIDGAGHFDLCFQLD